MEGRRSTQLGSAALCVVRSAETTAQEYAARFPAAVRESYSTCPKGREQVIAEHACRKYSDRVGHSAAAKALDAEAVCLAVIARVHHAETNYDEMLGQGYERWPARTEVEGQVACVLAQWRVVG